MAKDNFKTICSTSPPLMIRADANSKIGSGHLMRCMAMAREWQKRGGKVSFIGRIESTDLRKKIKINNFNFVYVDKSYPHKNDIKQIKNIISLMADKNTWVLLDGYHFDEAYHREIKKAGCRLIVLDDTGHLNDYGPDILLNPNPYAENIDYHFGSNTRSLLGSKYFLLRNEFLEWKEKQPAMPETAKNILVTLGGADHHNGTGTILRAIKNLKRSNLFLKVLVGPLNPHLAILESELSGAPFPYQIHTSAANMAAFMWKADLAISAGGGTSFELVYMGVPVAVTATADNQLNNVEALEKLDAAINLGPIHSLDEKRLSERIEEVIDSKEKRAALSESGKKIIDGKGIKRAVEAMAPTRLCIRKAEPGDCDQVFQWANDPMARASSYQSAFIPHDEHCQWFHSKLESPACTYYIVTNENSQKIGQVRFDRNKALGTISVNLDKNFRGIGLGNRNIKKACEQVLGENKVIHIQGFVKRENMSSLQAFKQAGFIPHKHLVHNGAPTTLMLYKNN